MTRVSVVGTGYVGLVTGACLAEKGCPVTCVDLDSERVDYINRAVSPLHEKGLAELLERNVPLRLRATTDCSDAVLNTDVTFLAVGTPLAREAIDLAYVEDACRSIGEALAAKSSYHVVAVKSTVVPGTTDDVVTPLLERVSRKQAGTDFGVGVNPEFLTEGRAVEDFLHPDRIVLGASDERALSVLKTLYGGFDAPIVTANSRTAEMIKYTSNALLATMISFANEIGNLCASLGGVDVVDVMRAMHLSEYLTVRRTDGARVTAPITAFLEAGCGFGGSCLPKDVRALVTHAHRAGYRMRLLESVLDINQHQHEQVLACLERRFPLLNGVRIAILGLAFKPDTDDTRDSPAIPIIRSLLVRGARVRVYDPVANDAVGRLFGDSVGTCQTLYDAVRNVDAVVLVTRWQEFEQLPGIFGGLDPQPLLIDGRRIVDKNRIADYDGIGLGPQPAMQAGR